MDEPMRSGSKPSRFYEILRLFLRLGFTAFGGPAVHISMMRKEVVDRRAWMDDEEFLDLVGATNLIPGPNSTEMSIHLGYMQAGWKGMLLSGFSFILPAASIVLALAWIYVRYSTTPAADGLLYGVKPVVIGVILQALWSLGSRAVKGPLTAGVGITALVLYFLGISEIPLLLAGGIVVMLIVNARRLSGMQAVLFCAPFLPTAKAAAEVRLTTLFLTFLKIGSVLYGSGYVLFAFLHTDFVQGLGWLTNQQLVDAVAVGQFTPGPVFTTATFIGFVLGGFPGAVLATAGIFLPSFIFVAISNPLIPRLRESAWFGAFLDGVNIAAMALMAAVTFQLGRASLVDPFTIGLAVAAAVLLFRFQVNASWLILGGAGAGLIWTSLT